jgi:hypothetical protein
VGRKLAAHGEKKWPPLGNSDGRPWGELHGRRHTELGVATAIVLQMGHS